MLKNRIVKRHKLEKGDLVIYRNVAPKVVDHFGIVLEVRNWGSLRPEEVFLKFPLDGSEGWFLSEKLIKVENEIEQSRQSPKPLSFFNRI